MESDYLTLKEAMQLARISYSAIRQKVYQGQLKVIKPGRQLLVHKDELKRFLLSTVVDPSARA